MGTIAGVRRSVQLELMRRLIDRLDDGLATQLGPAWPGGVDLSGGQWQKLALARGLLRDRPLLVVLDEPTSALDAETEHALFERFTEQARLAADDGRVTVLVSHRFSTVRMADQIVVLSGTRVAETGSHDELMARLGYENYYAQGGDWGAAVTTAIGVGHPESCLGIHLNMPTVRANPQADDLTDQEKDALEALKYYRDWDSGYSKQQSTRPQTVGYGLVDSPVAQMTWIVEKFWAWTDCDGHPENALTRDEMLDVYGAIAAAVDVPVSADLEHGYGDTADEVADTIRRAIDVGLVGGSIEDRSPHTGDRLLPIAEAAGRVAAARAAADATGVRFTLTARAESLFADLGDGVDAFDDAVARCRAYVESGADCVFAPGLADLSAIERFVVAVGAPVSVGIGSGGTALSVDGLAAAGVRRISTGGVIPRALDAALGGMLAELADGSFGFTADATVDTEMDARGDRPR